MITYVKVRGQVRRMRTEEIEEMIEDAQDVLDQVKHARHDKEEDLWCLICGDDHGVVACDDCVPFYEIYHDYDR